MNYREAMMNYQPDSEQEASDRKQMVSFIEGNEEENLPGVFDAVLYRNSIVHMTASAVVFNPERTKILMIKHNIYKTWAWPGGHADGDADLERVARKEVAEETGIENLKSIYPGVIALQTLTVPAHIKNRKTVSAHLHFNLTYAFEASGEEPLKIRQEENSGVDWILFDELEKYSDEPDFIKIYRKIRKSLLNYERKI